jgi:predicted nucleic acid-binding Zn ribbon protein
MRLILGMTIVYARASSFIVCLVLTVQFKLSEPSKICSLCTKLYDSFKRMFSNDNEEIKKNEEKRISSDMMRLFMIIMHIKFFFPGIT